MTDHLKALAELYRTARQRHHEVGDEIGQVKAHLAALSEEWADKDRLLKSLVPVLQQLEGGQGAMQEADQAVRGGAAIAPPKNAPRGADPAAPQGKAAELPQLPERGKGISPEGTAAKR